MASTDSSYKLTKGNEKKDEKKDSIVYKYIDVDSTYRVRSTYPNPNTFVIPFRISNDSKVYQDPICNSLPYKPDAAIVQTAQGGSTFTNIVLNASEITIDNFYINSYLEIAGEFRQVISYSATTFIAVVSVGFTIAPLIGAAYRFRKAIPIYIGTVGAPVTTTSFQLVGGVVTADNYSNGYIMLANGTTTRISTYNPTTQIVTLTSPLSVAPAPGDYVEVDAITKENATSLMGGDMSGTLRYPYYEIELLHLSLPYQTLNTGIGGQLDSYPFVYVELYNEGKQQSTQIFYSNNPSSSSALFKVPVNEYFGDKWFVTLKDSKAKQTVKFIPNSDLRFRVKLPSGETVSYVNSDNSSPFIPNPLVQTSALFSIRELPS
jgi:hypothetical protein